MNEELKPLVKTLRSRFTIHKDNNTYWIYDHQEETALEGELKTIREVINAIKKRLVRNPYPFKIFTNSRSD